MKRIHLVLLFILVAVIAAAAGMLTQQSVHKPKQTNQLGVVNSTRPDFSLADTEGNMRHIKEWDGKVVLLNFWASWCPPCRKELPDFVRLYDKYKDKGFVVVGVGIDKRQDLVDFMDQMGVEYPVMVAQTQGVALAQTYGDRLGALPYSVIIDRDGKIIETHINLLTYDQVEKAILPLL